MCSFDDMISSIVITVHAFALSMNIIINQTITISSGNDEMQNFLIFAMNAHHNQHAYLCASLLLWLAMIFWLYWNNIQVTQMWFQWYWCNCSWIGALLVIAVIFVCWYCCQSIMFSAFQFFIISCSIFNGFPSASV